jgi:hypothetical protein
MEGPNYDLQGKLLEGLDLTKKVSIFTEQERRIMSLLGDGKPHPVSELALTIDSDLDMQDDHRQMVVQAIFRLRQKITSKGLGIVCDRSGNSQGSYRLMRYMNDEE